MEQVTRIFLADDHPIFREGLIRSIEQETMFSVVGQAGNGEEAFERISEILPDIAILDISMPGINGLEVVRRLHKKAVPTEVIILTMHKDVRLFDAALDLGVRGYLLKETVAGELISCLKSVAAGEYYISPAVSHYLIEREKRTTVLPASMPVKDRLTPAELNVVKLLAENLTSQEIADRLFVSLRTIDNHRLHICQKLGVKGHNKLLQFALENKDFL